MKEYIIKSFDELSKLDFRNIIVDEEINIDIKLNIYSQNLNFPINIIHEKPDLESKINIKLALYGKSHINIPVEILVKNGAKGTSTNFKALVYIMDPQSKANITPGLLIHEKNINSAGHGVVIKNIKPKDTFYLESRGIEKEKAKELIVNL
jgi:Fe-S cluster assembly scaffold protein SufB